MYKKIIINKNSNQLLEAKNGELAGAVSMLNSPQNPHMPCIAACSKSLCTHPIEDIEDTVVLLKSSRTVGHKNTYLGGKTKIGKTREA